MGLVLDAWLVEEVASQEEAGEQLGEDSFWLDKCLSWVASCCFLELGFLVLRKGLDLGQLMTLGTHVLFRLLVAWEDSHSLEHGDTSWAAGDTRDGGGAVLVNLERASSNSS